MNPAALLLLSFRSANWRTVVRLVYYSPLFHAKNAKGLSVKFFEEQIMLLL